MSEKNNIPQIRFNNFDENWEVKEFKEIFSNLPNNTLSRAELNYQTGLFKNVHYGDVLIKFGELLDVKNDRIPFISNDAMGNKFKLSKLQNGDIIIADTAEDESVGRCTELINAENENVVSGLHTIPVRPIQHFASKYLGYYLNSSSYHDQLLQLMQGIKVLSISKSALKSTVLVYPQEKLEQSKIGTYFQNLDKLITLQQQKHDKLVTLKKAMLDKMFPKEGADVPEIRFKGFTEAWKEGNLGDLSESFEYGLNAPATPYDGTNKYLRITDIDDVSHNFNKNDLTTPKTNLNLAGKFKLSSNDILFARTGASVGKSYIYKESDGLVYFAGFLIRAIIKSEINAGFVFQNTLTERYIKFIRITSQRSGQPGVNAIEYSRYRFMIPTKKEQDKIDIFLSKLDKLISLHQQEIQKLKNIKKACLEKMFV